MILDTTSMRPTPYFFVDKTWGFAQFSIILWDPVSRRGIPGRTVRLVNADTQQTIAPFTTDSGGVVYTPKLAAPTSVKGVRATAFRFDGDSTYAPASTPAVPTGQLC